MNEHEVRGIVKAHIKQMRWLLQLQDWDIKVAIQRIDQHETIADVEYRTAYRLAVMRVDPSRCDGRTALLESVRHELIHLLLADYLTYKTTVNRMLTAEQASALEVVWQHAEERTVGNIERALDWGLRLPVDRMLERFDPSAYHGHDPQPSAPQAPRETPEQAQAALETTPAGT
jgi:hypothetical protein